MRGESVDACGDRWVFFERRRMVGLRRASITSEPVQPQCLCRVNAPTPCTSRAGSLRVNVIHKKLWMVLAQSSLSSHSTISGKPASAAAERSSWSQMRAIDSSSPSPEPAAENAGPCSASTPGKHTRGSRTPSGSDRPLGSSLASARFFSPTAAITSLLPWFKP